MNALEWDIEAALAAHERQQPGRVVSAFAFDIPGSDLHEPGKPLVAVRGPDAGRMCVSVRAEGNSLRVRFPEREAILPRRWLAEAREGALRVTPRRGRGWGSDWRSEGERWGDW